MELSSFLFDCLTPYTSQNETQEILSHICNPQFKVFIRWDSSAQAFSWLCAQEITFTFLAEEGFWCASDT